MTTTTITEDLRAAITAAEQVEILVESNEGTYGAAEAQRATGSGDPQHNNYRIYERVGDGKRRLDGCSPERAPGYSMRGGARALTEARSKLADMRAQLKATR